MLVSLPADELKNLAHVSSGLNNRFSLLGMNLFAMFQETASDPAG
jgi:hypothetical protein